MPRHVSSHYAKLNFVLSKLEKGYVALCLVCGRYLKNTASKRILAHRNVCREADIKSENSGTLVNSKNTSSTTSDKNSLQGKIMRSRGNVWKFFNFDKETKRVSCKYCNKQYKRNATRMQEHLNLCTSFQASDEKEEFEVKYRHKERKFIIRENKHIIVKTCLKRNRNKPKLLYNEKEKKHSLDEFPIKTTPSKTETVQPEDGKHFKLLTSLVTRRYLLCSRIVEPCYSIPLKLLYSSTHTPFPDKTKETNILSLENFHNFLGELGRPRVLENIETDDLQNEDVTFETDLIQVEHRYNTVTPSERSHMPLKRRYMEDSGVNYATYVNEDRKDEFDIFGVHVANELRKIKQNAMLLANTKHELNEILHKAVIESLKSESFVQVVVDNFSS